MLNDLNQELRLPMPGPDPSEGVTASTSSKP
jgi:hypothetical protein